MDPGSVARAGIHRRLAVHKLMQDPFAVCISGHRPEKLPSGSALHMMQSLLYREIEAAIAEGADCFYAGMARGTDLWAADMILHFRSQHPQIRLIAVLPYRDRISTVRGAERFHVHAVLQSADSIITLSEHYFKGCFRARNAYMIAHSRRLIALMLDDKSGTGQTIRMAKRAGLELRILSAEMAKQQTAPAHEFFRF